MTTMTHATEAKSETEPIGLEGFGSLGQNPFQAAFEEDEDYEEPFDPDYDDEDDLDEDDLEEDDLDEDDEEDDDDDLDA